MSRRGGALERRLPLAGGGDRPPLLPVSTFAALFCEVISYHRTRTASIAELESRLSEAGYGVGVRLLELLSLRSGRRETDAVSAVKALSGAVWTQLFGRPADHLDVNKDAAGAEYRIWDNLPVTNTFISLPKEYARFNPAAFVAGIVRGMLDGAGFSCTVSAMNAASDGPVEKTVYVIRFTGAAAPGAT